MFFILHFQKKFGNFVLRALTVLRVDILSTEMLISSGYMVLRARRCTFSIVSIFVCVMPLHHVWLLYSRFNRTICLQNTSRPFSSALAFFNELRSVVLSVLLISFSIERVFDFVLDDHFKQFSNCYSIVLFFVVIGAKFVGVMELLKTFHRFCLCLSSYYFASSVLQLHPLLFCRQLLCCSSLSVISNVELMSICIQEVSI